MDISYISANIFGNFSTIYIISAHRGLNVQYNSNIICVDFESFTTYSSSVYHSISRTLTVDWNG